MDNKTVTVQTGGLQMFILFVVFLVLKLTHIVNWSWWWITAPLWGPIALLIPVTIGVIIWYNIVNR